MEKKNLENSNNKKGKTVYVRTKSLLKKFQSKCLNIKEKSEEMKKQKIQNYKKKIKTRKLQK